MDTKLKGDIAEQAAILQALKRDWGVAKTIGDRHPYDLIFDVNNNLIRIQVKSAWFYEPDDCYLTDNRRTNTNRRRMIRNPYQESDFDFALVFIEEFNLFYVFPVRIFIAYASAICFVESDKRQRKPRSANYRDAWDLISNWAPRKEIFAGSPVKVGKPFRGGNPEPSFSSIAEEGVET